MTEPGSDAPGHAHGTRPDAPERSSAPCPPTEQPTRTGLTCNDAPANKRDRDTQDADTILRRPRRTGPAWFYPDRYAVWIDPTGLLADDERAEVAAQAHDRVAVAHAALPTLDPFELARVAVAYTRELVAMDWRAPRPPDPEPIDLDVLVGR